MKRSFLILILSSIHISQTLATDHKLCQKMIDSLGASYEITTESLLPPYKKTHSTIKLWREKNRVAYSYPEQKITEIWSHLKNKEIRPVRYFDQYQRGIEYQPGDVHEEKLLNQWQKIYQLIDNKQLQSLQLLTPKNTECEQQQSYMKKTPQQQLEVIWMNQYQLPKSFSTTTKDTKVTWTLERLTLEPSKVKAFFEKENQYKMTDYADIGDSESDPFLNKMIHLGFTHPI